MYKKRCLAIVLGAFLLCMFVHSQTNAETAGTKMKPLWQTSACYQLRLSVADKFGIDPTYRAKYVVKAAGNEIYIAEREGVAGVADSSLVFFPDDFVDQRTNQKAFVSCSSGQKYTYEIYGNNVLMETGTIEFKRHSIKNVRKGR